MGEQTAIVRKIHFRLAHRAYACGVGRRWWSQTISSTGGEEMVTPVDEPARTMTTKGHQSLLVPDPAAELDRVVDDCGFRMLEPYEVAAAMAFPAGYIPLDLPKKDQVKLAGNAVTPPVMTWILGRVLQALEAAS